MIGTISTPHLRCAQGSVLLVLAFALAGPLAAQPVAGQLQGTVIEFPNLDPVELGWGWDDRRTGAVRQSCIEFRRAQEDYIDKRMSLQMANDHEALSRALNVSLAGKMTTMAGSKFSASASFAHNASLTSAGEHVAILAEGMTAPEFVAPLNGPNPAVAQLSTSPDGGSVDMRSFYRGGAVRLKDDMLKLAVSKPAEFVKQCGTGFVAVVHRGARINALLTFREVEAKDRQELKLAAKGSGGGYSINASMNSLVEKYNKAGKLEIKFEQLGGTDKNFPMDKTALLEAVSGLPTEARKQPRPFMMVVQKYNSLPGWPDTVVLPELTDEEVLTRSYFRLLTLMSFADEALSKPGAFLLKFDTARSDIVKLHDQILEDRTALLNLVRACRQGTCAAGAWREWSDMAYRARMPMLGSFGSLSYPLGSDGIDRIPALVAEQRVSRWIVEPNQWRCQYESECMKQAEIEAYREQIRSNVAKSIGLP